MQGNALFKPTFPLWPSKPQVAHYFHCPFSVKFAPNLFTSSCVFCSDPVPGASSRLTWATARVSWRSPGVHSRHTEAVSVQKPAFGDADHILLLSCVTYSRLPPPRSTVRVKPKRAGTTHTPYSAVPLVAVGPRRRRTLGAPSSRLSPGDVFACILSPGPGTAAFCPRPFLRSSVAFSDHSLKMGVSLALRLTFEN